MTSRSGPRHEYAACITWTGNTGAGTGAYDAYTRDYTVSVPGKPQLHGSADPAYRGAADRHNPEDLFVAAVSACHMLFYLSLAARSGVQVAAYSDNATGRLATDRRGGGRFETIVLRPNVDVAAPRMIDAALSLHEIAHQQCFIAASCRVPIVIEPVVGASAG
jgi:organic hydroperoxide reductase OsmC/OhrA